MKYLLGPELFWLLMYGAATLLVKFNTPPTKEIADSLENLYLWIPLASLLVFGLWWIPSVEKNWLLLLRVWVFGVIGGHFVIEKAISVFGQSGAGIGMSYVASFLYLLILMVAGSIFVVIRF